jgi:hypothetical protein
MNLFTIEIAGLAIVVFPEENLSAARQLVEDGFMRDDLMCLDHEGHTLWDGEAELFVRAAEDEEIDEWEEGFAEAHASGEADIADKEDWAVFLIEVTDAEDEEPE